MDSLLDPNGIWDLEIHKMGDKGYFEYYGYTIRKAKGVDCEVEST